MLALIPLLAGLVPEIVRLFAGDKAGTVAGQVSDVVQAVAGGTDLATVQAALADPVKAMELRLALARIAADAEAATRQAETADLVARLADTADARRQTVALAAGGSPIAYGAVACSLVVLVAFGGVLALILTRALPGGSETLANMLLGALATMAGTAVNYWLGSSSGSARKDGTIANQAASNAGR